MSISKYEAAAFYDHVNKHSVGRYLVIDLDDCSYGFCECDAFGKTALLNSCTSINTDLWELCVNSIRNAAGSGDSFDFLDETDTQLAANNEVLHKYIVSDRIMDSELSISSNQTMLCSEFEEVVHPVKSKLDELFGNIDKRIDSSALEDSYIIILGRAQELFLINCYIRELLGSEPLLPDERFRNTEFKDPYNEIVKIGAELFELKKTIQHSYSLLLFSKKTNTIERVLIAQKGQPKDEEDLKLVKYTEPILLAADDELSMEIDEKVVKVKIPYSFAPVDNDLVQAAIGEQNGKEVLFIRRCRFPTRIYTVELEQKT